ncbi:MAG: hypothetical protein AB7E24_03730 [Novosphingobium sp.]
MSGVGPRIGALATAIALIGLAQPAFAQAQDEVIVSGEDISGVSGRLAVNLAAGDGNQAANDAVIAIGDLALGGSLINQSIAGRDPRDRATRVALEGDAFANSSGLASINAAAGIQNQMANVAVLSIGKIGAISDQLLAQSSAPSKPSGSTGGGADARNDVVAVSDDAFRDSSGLIQVNLIGGERNSSANTFVLSVLPEGSP